MAKTKGPLHSSEAHGTFGDSLSFSKYKGTQRAFKKSKPRNPRSDNQQLQRSYLSQAIIAWRVLDQSSKQYWEQQAQASGKRMSGYNYFISDYINTMLVPPPPPSPIMDQLLYWWKFNENAGAQAYDEIENLLMTLTACLWQPGHEGSSVELNGTTSYGTASGATVPATDELTYEFWLRPADSGGPYGGFVGVDSGWHCIHFEGRPNMRFDIYADGIGWDFLNWTNAEPGFYDNWHHFACRWKRLTTQDIYYDNVQKAHRTPNRDGQAKAQNTIHIGLRYANKFAGRIDEARIYNKLLSEEEIDNNFNL